MRTKQCFSIGVGRCVESCNIKIFIRLHELGKIEISGNDIVDHEIRTRDGLDEFARSDGFSDWNNMRKFWLEEHAGECLNPFSGVLIQWEPIR